jgi:hypothetical protein
MSDQGDSSLNWSEKFLLRTCALSRLKILGGLKSIQREPDDVQCRHPSFGKPNHPAAFTEVDKLLSWVKLTSQLPASKSENDP